MSTNWLPNVVISISNPIRLDYAQSILSVRTIGRPYLVVPSYLNCIMTDRTITRRRLISLAGAGAVVGLAGCGDLGETDEDETTADEDGETDEDGELDEDDEMNDEDGLEEEEDDDADETEAGDGDDGADENGTGDEDDDAEVQEIDGYGRDADLEDDGDEESGG